MFRSLSSLWQGVVVNPLPPVLTAAPDDAEAFHGQLTGDDREALVVKAGKRRANQVYTTSAADSTAALQFSRVPTTRDASDGAGVGLSLSPDAGSTGSHRSPGRPGGSPSRAGRSVLSPTSVYRSPLAWCVCGGERV